MPQAVGGHQSCSTQVILWMLCFPYHCVRSLSGVASLTYYTSYPECCPDEVNYDPSADTTECDLYNGCEWAGYFAALEGKQSYEYVANSSLIAFYEYGMGEESDHFHNIYAGNNITLMKGGNIIFEAMIVDTCADSDCSGCCSANSADTGFLVDLEYNTMMRNFNDSTDASGTIEFFIDVDYDPSWEIDNDVVDDMEMFVMIVGIVMGLLLMSIVVFYVWFPSRWAFCRNMMCEQNEESHRQRKKEWNVLSMKSDDVPSAVTEQEHRNSDEKHTGALSTSPPATTDSTDQENNAKPDTSTAITNPARSGRPLCAPPQAPKNRSPPPVPPPQPPTPGPCISSIFEHKDESDIFSNINPSISKC